MTTFLYLIENTLNNKIYIGKTVAPQQRWINHKSIANVGPSNKNYSLIHKALRKHLSNLDKIFKFEIFAIFETDLEAYQMEIYWINYLKSQGLTLYNVSEGGEGFKSGNEHPNFGKPLSNDIKNKISKGNKGKIRSPEALQRASKSRKGKYVGDNCKNSRLKEFQVIEIKNALKGILSLDNNIVVNLTTKYNISRGTLYDIKDERTWKHIKV